MTVDLFCRRTHRSRISLLHNGVTAACVKPRKNRTMVLQETSWREFDILPCLYQQPSHPFTQHCHRGVASMRLNQRGMTRTSCLAYTIARHYSMSPWNMKI